MVGKTITVDDQSEIIFFDITKDVAMATNFCSIVWVLLDADG